jgi:gliding motility-associated-like protein
VTIGVIIPEIITPNGDGVNDTFEILGLDQFNNPTIKIYNRWGNLVYEAAPYHNDWTGLSEGRLTIDKKKYLPAATYFYVLDLGQGYKPITGWVYLNR